MMSCVCRQLLLLQGKGHGTGARRARAVVWLVVTVPLDKTAGASVSPSISDGLAFPRAVLNIKL